jgi:hypothetical protein
MSNLRTSLVVILGSTLFHTACGTSTDTINHRSHADRTETSGDQSFFAAGSGSGNEVRKVEFDLSSKGKEAGCIDWDLTVAASKPMMNPEMKRDEKVQKDIISGAAASSTQVKLKIRTRGSNDILSFESSMANNITLTGTAKACETKSKSGPRAAETIELNEQVSSSANAKLVNLLDVNALGAQILWSARPR